MNWRDDLRAIVDSSIAGKLHCLYDNTTYDTVSERSPLRHAQRHDVGGRGELRTANARYVPKPSSPEPSCGPRIGRRLGRSSNPASRLRRIVASGGR